MSLRNELTTLAVVAVAMPMMVPVYLGYHLVFAKKIDNYLKSKELNPRI